MTCVREKRDVLWSRSTAKLDSFKIYCRFRFEISFDFIHIKIREKMYISRVCSLTRLCGYWWRWHRHGEGLAFWWYKRRVKSTQKKKRKKSVSRWIYWFSTWKLIIKFDLNPIFITLKRIKRTLYRCLSLSLLLRPSWDLPHRLCDAFFQSFFRRADQSQSIIIELQVSMREREQSDIVFLFWDHLSGHFIFDI